MLQFNRVVIRNRTEQANNIHLAVHPFPFDSHIRSFASKGEYTRWADEQPLGAWHRKIADALFDGVPGLSTLFFKNGEITIQHTGAFSDEEIVEAATVILQPFLEEQLRLQTMLTTEEHDAND